MHNDLDTLLMTRAAPQACPHLAEMIIANAKPRAARAPRENQSLLALFQDIFMLPQPAMVLALVLFVGIFVGVYAAPAQALSDPNGSELSSFLKIKDSFDMGEWL